MRKLSILSLAISIAVFGCTMNRTPANGQPVTATPYGSPASTPGSSSGTGVNVPMASAYPSPSIDRLTADQAAAIMREHQAYNGRILGYLNPAPMIGPPGSEIVTGQFISPAQYTNPQLTVNSSISSPQGFPVMTSGAGGIAPTGDANAFVVPGDVSNNA